MINQSVSYFKGSMDYMIFDQVRRNRICLRRKIFAAADIFLIVFFNESVRKPYVKRVFKQSHSNF